MSGLDEITKQAGKNVDDFINGIIFSVGEKFGGLVNRFSEGVGNTANAVASGTLDGARGLTQNLTPNVDTPNTGKEIEGHAIAKTPSIEVSTTSVQDTAKLDSALSGIDLSSLNTDIAVSTESFSGNDLGQMDIATTAISNEHFHDQQLQANGHQHG